MIRVADLDSLVARQGLLVVGDLRELAKGLNVSASESPSRTEVTQARLLESATQAFADKGFFGTTTRDITSAAGTSTAALYVHHRSKEELLYQISKSGHETTLQAVRRGREDSVDVREQLRVVVEDFVADHAENHTRSRIVNFELSALGPDHLEEILALRRLINAEMVDLISQGIAEGIFDIDEPRVAASVILSSGIDVARWYDGDYRLTPHQLGREYARVALRIVQARGVH